MFVIPHWTFKKLVLWHSPLVFFNFKKQNIHKKQKCSSVNFVAKYLALTKCFKRKKRKWDNTGGIHVQDKLATSRLYSEIWGRRVSGMGYLCYVIISLIPSVNYILLSLTHAGNNSLVLSFYYFYSLTFYYFDLLYTFPPRACCYPQTN